MGFWAMFVLFILGICGLAAAFKVAGTALKVASAVIGLACLVWAIILAV